jgi:hypothetical protein
MLKRIASELKEHAPFTLLGAVVGIVVMVIIDVTNASSSVSEAFFYSLHPLHIVFSALVTTAMFRLNKKGPLWVAVAIGYSGSVGIATLSDIIIPYLGGGVLDIPMEFHLPFLEAEKMPFIGIPKWIVINGSAVIGIAIACWRPFTRLPHMGHVLLSTWASLFSFTAFGQADWTSVLLPVFFLLFLAVWLPCCVSDIVYPLLWVGKEHRG